MELVEAVDPEGFRRYLADSGNTICGRHPISVLLHVSTPLHVPLPACLLT